MRRRFVYLSTVLTCPNVAPIFHLIQLKKQLLTLFEDVITLALFIENSEISMCLLPGLVSWSWIRGQEGDPAADPPQLYAAPAIAWMSQTFCLNWINI